MIIVIASAKGGSGKTTTAIHLAEFLSRKRALKRVVLMDGDPDNLSATGWYQRGDEWKFELIQSDDELGEYDALIVDSGAAPDGEELEELLEVASLLIVPTAPAPMDLESAVGTVAPFGGDKTVQILVTLAPPGRSRAGDDAVEVLREADLFVSPQVIRRRSVLTEVSGLGTTVAKVKGDAAKKAWAEYQTAFKYLLKEVM